jgi:hypothetical protein
MRIVVILTSLISPLAGKTTLTDFERFTQTIASIHSIKLQLPKAKIIFCDASKYDYGLYIQKFYPDVHNCCVSAFDPKMARAILHSHNKSWGECQLMLSAFSQFRDILEDCDFVIKLSARYLPENLDSSWFVGQHKGKYMFCREQPSDIRDWTDNNGFTWSLARSLTYPNVRRKVFRTILYALGRDVLSDFISILIRISADLSLPEYYHYDVEHLISRELAPAIYNNAVIRTNWQCLGWNGMTAGLDRW